MKKSHIYALIYVCFPVIAFFAGWTYFLFGSVVPQDRGVVYYLKPGSSKTSVMQELREQGIVTHSVLFSLYAMFHPGAHLVSAEYRFPRGSSPYSIWRQITTGTGLEQHPFMIIPGWTFAQVRKALDQAPSLKHMTTPMNDKQIMSYLGHEDVAPEGEFFPETYYYTYGMQDLVVLKRAYDLMQNRLNEAWGRRATDLPYKSAYEALIVASLIEKEAYLNSERETISGVVLNRLRKNMLLQIDATVIYGLGDRYTGTIFKKDLKEDTAFNTYVHKGLPPTPIAMPGMSSIEAAMHPQQHEYIYYVAKGNGAHQFSTTLQQHDAAIKSAKNMQTPTQTLTKPVDIKR